MKDSDTQIQVKGGEEKMDEIQQTIFREVCPHCGKEITSLSRTQAEYNFKAHLLSCKLNPENISNGKQ
jgi:hypothetical protein